MILYGHPHERDLMARIELRKESCSRIKCRHFKIKVNLSGCETGHWGFRKLEFQKTAFREKSI